jgi:PKD repeat protein
MEDPEGDAFDWTITTSPDIGSSSGSGESNGTKTCSVSGLTYLTTYTWFVNATDGINWTNLSYSFTTFSEPANYPPLILSPSVSNGSTGVSTSINSLSANIQDPDGDFIDWTIQTQPSIGASTGSNENNGTKACAISSLSYDTSYKWFVNASDGYNDTCVFFTFSTESAPQPPPPIPPPPSPPPPAQNESEEENETDPENHAPDTPLYILGPEVIEPGVAYMFSVSTNDSDGDMIRFRFDWDDGNLSNWTSYVNSSITAYATHIWYVVQNFSIRVIAQDIHGLNSSWSNSYNITMSFAEDDEADVTDKQDKFDYEIEKNTVTFNYSSESVNESAEIVSWVWDFGDGNTYVGNNPTHEYKNPGTYTVKLVITDSQGNSYTETKIVEVTTGSSDTIAENNNFGLTYAAILVAIIIILSIFVMWLIRRQGLISLHSVHVSGIGNRNFISKKRQFMHSLIKKEKGENIDKKDKKQLFSNRLFTGIQNWYEDQYNSKFSDEEIENKEVDEKITTFNKTDSYNKISSFIDKLPIKNDDLISIKTKDADFRGAIDYINLVERRIDGLIHASILKKIENL